MKRVTTAILAAAYKDPKLSAELAGLTYGSASTPGWTREKHGKSFTYKDQKGKPITDEKKRARLDALVLPPAWKDVWISPYPKSHIQATGIDVKGITQYRYHPKWNALREVLKFYRLAAFSTVLPKLRTAIHREMNQSEPTRSKVIATALALVDQLALRIGNEDYAAANNTYGVTTLRTKHITVQNDHIELNFVGKSHQEQSFELTDKKLATALKQELALPGTHLFQYLDDEHKKHPLTASEVNDFIHTVTGTDLTAKDFRTWIGTVEAYKLMKASLPKTTTPHDDKVAAKALKAVLTDVAGKLGNTVAVCKAHYVHGELQSLYLSGGFGAACKRAGKAPATKGLHSYEAELAFMLEKLSSAQLAAIK